MPTPRSRPPRAQYPRLGRRDMLIGLAVTLATGACEAASPPAASSGSPSEPAVAAAAPTSPARSLPKAAGTAAPPSEALAVTAAPPPGPSASVGVRTLLPTARPTPPPRAHAVTVPLPGAVVSLAFADPLIFAAAPGAGIQAVDIRSPTRRGWRTRSSARSMSSPLKADCCSDSASARRLRSARSIWPSWTHHREVDVPLGIGAATFGNVAIEGGLAVVAGGSAPMSVLDVSNPASIRLLARVPSVVNIAAVRLRNRRAYCSVAVAGDGRLGIAVFDLSDATRPAHLFTVRATRADGLSRARLPGHFDVRAEAVGSILFTAAHGSLSTISLLDLGAPSALATLHMTPDAVHLARWGERLVVAGGDVDLIDVATPAAPRPLARVATPGTAREALIARDHLYVADGEAGLSVYRL